MRLAAAPGIRGPRGAVPAALGRHRAWPPLVEEGRERERPRRRARPPHRTAAPRSAAYHCGRAVGCARHRGEREEDKGGEERGDPDRGLISSNLEVLFAKCLGPQTAEKKALDMAQRALVLARWQGQDSSIRDWPYNAVTVS